MWRKMFSLKRWRCGYKALWWKTQWFANVLSKVDGYSYRNAVPETDLNHTFAEEEKLISEDNKYAISTEPPFSYFTATLKLPYPK